MGYELVEVTRKNDWKSYHRIRKQVLFEDRGRFSAYDPNHPDEFLQSNTPLLLKLNGSPLGTVRLDRRDEQTAVVRLVAIKKGEQRKGHGKALDRKLLSYAKKKLISVLYVNAAPEAIGYYKKTGWQEHLWDASELQRSAKECIQMRKYINGDEHEQ